MSDQKPDEQAHEAQDTLGSPYGSMMSAAQNQYHAVKSINKFGAISHAAELARQYVEHHIVTNEIDALTLAQASVMQVRLQADGVNLHQKAHEVLKQRTKTQNAPDVIQSQVLVKPT